MPCSCFAMPTSSWTDGGDSKGARIEKGLADDLGIPNMTGEDNRMKLINGDCLAEMDKLITEGITVDAIITDPPYGTTACKWDSIIPFDAMWERLNKLIKPNGAIVLFGSEPFSSALRMSNIKNYKYFYNLLVALIHTSKSLPYPSSLAHGILRIGIKQAVQNIPTIAKSFLSSTSCVCWQPPSRTRAGR